MHRREPRWASLPLGRGRLPAAAEGAEHIGPRRGERTRGVGVLRTRGKPVRTVIALAIGSAAWAAFALWLHAPLIGIRAIG